MFITFGMITPTVAVIALVIALVIFGPGKLPDLGKALGKGISEFKDATNGNDKEEVKVVKSEVKEEKKEDKE
ncbi:twin-arginine translocase TatA/TatE family subunit [Desulfitobacterium sp.]|uniref:twin-arginine translocase TatA/TatE family subunit n=1 Tax=Desulfitobacterium sp. TaxID=49981 RepID=UPI002B1FD184|nr:twin-arginine translocase TatA/TatE family subunit [Desulfitobacterium sp.]MEA4901144.1 twin-arginine translocase TatA/TatE family subunit [Desulfitobacterium sp.]